MSKDLFAFNGEQLLQKNSPLADRLRPQTLDEFVGQEDILAEGRLLRRSIVADKVGNLLLYGPPGVGKTTLARIIASNTLSHFSVLNATLAGIKDLRSEIDSARERLNKYSLRTILFIDEVHRFNTGQQDALLPWVENGTLTLIGATTENPYFEVNKALVSRARVFRLKSLNSEALHQLLIRALNDDERGYGKKSINISNDASNHLVDVANGDARTLLNALELAVESTPSNNEGVIKIDLKIAEESIQERAVLYDKGGDAHYDTISAFIKSLRGSDPDAALFWLAQMLEAGENPRFIFRRMLIAAVEDVGLADPQAIVVVESCAASFDRIGLPEGIYPIAQAALYLAVTDKSNSIKGVFNAVDAIRNYQTQNIPSHLKDPNRDQEAFGDGIGYKYPHAFADNWIPQQYLPERLKTEVFWKPSHHGWEGERRPVLTERRAEQLAAIFEASQQNPLTINTRPINKELDKWLIRQITQEGERLKKLMIKLWSDVDWQQNHRVLVITPSSLLWSLKPLKEVHEGGVILLSSIESHSRLDAEIAALDPIDRPILIDSTVKSFTKLDEDYKFEVVGGRIPWKLFSDKEFSDLWPVITQKCTKNAQLSLLLTTPFSGPANVLKEGLDMKTLKNIDISLLNDLIVNEKKWLTQEDKKTHLLLKLNQLGWKASLEEWTEFIYLKVDEKILQRWFAENGDYQRTVLKDYDKQSLNYFKSIFELLKGKTIKQKLLHSKLLGKLDA